MLFVVATIMPSAAFAHDVAQHHGDSFGRMTHDDNRSYMCDLEGDGNRERIIALTKDRDTWTTEDTRANDGVCATRNPDWAGEAVWTRVCERNVGCTEWKWHD